MQSQMNSILLPQRIESQQEATSQGNLQSEEICKSSSINEKMKRVESERTEWLRMRDRHLQTIEDQNKIIKLLTEENSKLLLRTQTNEEKMIELEKTNAVLKNELIHANETLSDLKTNSSIEKPTLLSTLLEEIASLGKKVANLSTEVNELKLESKQKHLPLQHETNELSFNAFANSASQTFRQIAQEETNVMNVQSQFLCAKYLSASSLLCFGKNKNTILELVSEIEKLSTIEEKCMNYMSLFLLVQSTQFEVLALSFTKFQTEGKWKSLSGDVKEGTWEALNTPDEVATKGADPVPTFQEIIAFPELFLLFKESLDESNPQLLCALEFLRDFETFFQRFESKYIEFTRDPSNTKINLSFNKTAPINQCSLSLRRSNTTDLFVSSRNPDIESKSNSSSKRTSKLRRTSKQRSPKAHKSAESPLSNSSSTSTPIISVENSQAIVPKISSPKSQTQSSTNQPQQTNSQPQFQTQSVSPTQTHTPLQPIPLSNSHSTSEIIGSRALGDVTVGYTEKQLQLSTECTEITRDDITAAKLNSQTLRTFLNLSSQNFTFCASVNSMTDDTMQLLWLGFEANSGKSFGIKILQVDESNLLKDFHDLSVPTAPLCLCQWKSDVWVGTRSGFVYIFPLSSVIENNVNQYPIELGQVHAHEAAIISLRYYERNMWSLGENNQIRVWNPQTRRCLKTISLNFKCRTMAFTSEEFHTVWAGSKVINTHTFKQNSLEALGCSSLILALCYVPIAKEIWSAHEDKTIVMWDAETRAFKGIVQLMYFTHSLFCFERFVWSTTGSSLIVWYAKTHTVIREIEIVSSCGYAFECSSFTLLTLSDGHLMAIATTPHHGLVCWDTPFNTHSFIPSNDDLGKSCVYCKKKLSSNATNCEYCKSIPLHTTCCQSFITRNTLNNSLVSCVCPKKFDPRRPKLLSHEEEYLYLSADHISHQAKFPTSSNVSNSRPSRRTVCLKKSLSRGGWASIDSVQLSEIINGFSLKPETTVSRLLTVLQTKQDSDFHFDSFAINTNPNMKTNSNSSSIISSNSVVGNLNEASKQTQLIAQFLYENRTRLDPNVIGTFLGKKENKKLRYAWVEQVELIVGNIEMSFRRFLRTFNLPSEGQMIDRLCEAFASVYTPYAEKDFSSNPNKKPEEQVYGFVTFLLLLNTSLHNPNSHIKMTLADFIKTSHEFSVSKHLAKHCYHQLEDLPFEFFSPLPLPLLQGTFLSNSTSVWGELTRKCLTIRRDYGHDYTKRIPVKQLCVEFNGNKSLTFIYNERNMSTSSNLTTDGSGKVERLTLNAKSGYSAQLWFRLCTELGAEKSASSLSPKIVPSYSNATPLQNSPQKLYSPSKTYTT